MGVKRKAKRKACQSCVRLLTKLAASENMLAAKSRVLSRYENEIVPSYQQTSQELWAMIAVLCKALERNVEMLALTLNAYKSAQNLRAFESRAFADFFHDVQLLRSQGAHALCGASWIRADALDAACKKYAEATEKIR